MTLNTLAIIPARGGSKGIPYKNIRTVGNRPLVSIAVENAIQATQVNRVVVSTDDSQIGQTAIRFGAEVVWRPPEISGDRASSEAALLHTLQFLREQENYQPDLVVFLQCTSPLVLPEDIDNAISILLKQNADVVFAATEVHQFLWQQADDNSAIAINHDQTKKRLMRQDIQPQFKEIGAIYVLKAAEFIRVQHRFFGQIQMYPMPKSRAIDIDEPVDLMIAETLYQHQCRRQILNNLPAKPAAIVLDFDGVFTDNRVLVSENGIESVFCNRSDGLGIARLKLTGVPIIVISSEKNSVVNARCNKLKLESISGADSKLPILKQWLADHNLQPQNVIYVGNDLNDLDCMTYVGCGVAVRDAVPQIKKVASITLQTVGGRGAIRELSDLLLDHLELS